MTEERRYQPQRNRLRDQNGKIVTTHMPASVLRHINSIIEGLSEKDDRLTMRDAICLAITTFGDRVEYVHSQSKIVRRRTGETDAQREQRDKWKGIRKECRGALIAVRADYPKIQRGRRPKGWTPPPTREEEKRAYYLVPRNMIRRKAERDAAVASAKVVKESESE